MFGRICFVCWQRPQTNLLSGPESFAGSVDRFGNAAWTSNLSVFVRVFGRGRARYLIRRRLVTDRLRVPDTNGDFGPGCEEIWKEIWPTSSLWRQFGRRSRHRARSVVATWADVFQRSPCETFGRLGDDGFRKPGNEADNWETSKRFDFSGSAN